MSPKRRRKFTREFKLRVLVETVDRKSVAQASREHPLHPPSWGGGLERFCESAILP
jgi:transposase-like protein